MHCRGQLARKTSFFPPFPIELPNQVDLKPILWAIESWKLPGLMGGPEREDDDEDVEVQRSADRLHFAPGGRKDGDWRGVPVCLEYQS